MARIALEFTGFDSLMRKLKNLGTDAKGIAEEALERTHAHITPKLEQAIAKHHLTGETAESLKRDAVVHWNKETAEVRVGFDIANGGLPSIFLMYGTKQTPRHAATRRDKALFDAVYSKQTTKEVQELQQNAFLEGVRRAMSK